MWRAVVLTVVVLVAAVLVSHTGLAQPPPMHHGSMSQPGAPQPTQPGQQAFAALAEVVRLLDADPATDWSTVDLERLRRHLIDMDEVVMRATVTQAPVSGGLVMDVTGTGRTEQAILSMVLPHAHELDRLPTYTARAEQIAGGVRLTVTAKRAEDARAVARIRGLGFAGLLTEGSHHGPHHLAMARGKAVDHAH